MHIFILELLQSPLIVFQNITLRATFELSETSHCEGLPGVVPV